MPPPDLIERLWVNKLFGKDASRPMKRFVPVLCLFAAFLAQPSVAAVQDAAPTPSPVVKDNEEVARMYAEDQSDRQPKDGKPIDWNVAGPRDEARQKRVMELYTADALKTGKDYFLAGMIFQHGEKPEDYLLCHELCVAAVFKSGRNEKPSWLPTAKWLAAASEDRFLLSIGRAQRFGTQFTADQPNSLWHLDKMEEGISDALRKAWEVPTLAEAKEREAEMNKKLIPK